MDQKPRSADERRSSYSITRFFKRRTPSQSKRAKLYRAPIRQRRKNRFAEEISDEVELIPPAFPEMRSPAFFSCPRPIVERTTTCQSVLLSRDSDLRKTEPEQENRQPMRTAQKKVGIAGLLLALAVGLFVRQGPKSSATQDQSSAVNSVRPVAHLNFRRILKTRPNVTASDTKNANPQASSSIESQAANPGEPQQNAVLNDSRPRNETRASAAVGREAIGKEGQDEHWILFLFLRMRNDTIELISSCRSPGVLKTARGARKVGPIDYDIVTATGEPIGSGTMEDPSIERREYPVGENTGALNKTRLKLNEVEFTLRVPWKKEAWQLQFYRRQLIESPAGQQVERRPLSNLTLPSYERSTL
ncbi:MAG: hypothetical protein ABI651_13025 [Verrucomicrobiota bacterium]